MEQTGRIIEVMEPKSGKSSKTGNPWMIQEYVLEIPGQYPRRCMFSIYGEERIKQKNVEVRPAHSYIILREESEFVRRYA